MVRADVAALYPAAAGGRIPWRRRALPARCQMGLVRRQRSRPGAREAEAIEVGDHGFFPRAGLHHAGRLHQDRHRAGGALRRALCAELATTGDVVRARSTRIASANDRTAAKRAMKVLYTDVLVLGGGRAGPA